MQEEEDDDDDDDDGGRCCSFHCRSLSRLGMEQFGAGGGGFLCIVL